MRHRELFNSSSDIASSSGIKRENGHYSPEYSEGLLSDRGGKAFMTPEEESNYIKNLKQSQKQSKVELNKLLMPYAFKEAKYGGGEANAEAWRVTIRGERREALDAAINRQDFTNADYQEYIRKLNADDSPISSRAQSADEIVAEVETGSEVEQDTGDETGSDSDTNVLSSASRKRKDKSDEDEEGDRRSAFNAIAQAERNLR